MSTKGIDLYRDLAKRLGRDKLSVITGTNTSSTNTSLTDATRLKYSSGDANAYDRVSVYVMTASDAALRGFSQITEAGYDFTNGTCTLSPAIASLANTDIYILTHEHPDDLHEAIDEVQRNDYYECLYPLSMHVVQNDCNDMEASTVATDWEVGTGAAAAAANTTIVYSGVQSLALTCNSANEYAALKSVVPVNEDMILHAAIMCSVTQGDDAAFRVWNAQSAEIDSATSDEVAWMNLQPPPFTIPSGCEQIDFRLEGIGANDVTYWDDFQVWYDGAGIYPLPAYIQSPSQLLDVRAVPQGTPGPGADNDYRTNEYASYPLSWRWESKNPNSMRIKVNCGEARPYLVTLRPRAELSSDLATTTANPDWVVAMAEKLIREPEEASLLLRSHVAAQLVRPVTRVSRVGTRIR